MSSVQSVRAHRSSSASVVAFAAFIAFTFAVAPPSVARTKSKSATSIAIVSATSNGPPKHVTDIPEFPGAWRTQGNRDGDGAQASLHLLVLSMRMQALRFETDASQAKVLEFYRERLAPLGKLNESDHGPNTNFGDFHWAESPGQHSITAESDHRVLMVATKQHGKGCEFALVRLEFEEK